MELEDVAIRTDRMGDTQLTQTRHCLQQRQVRGGERSREEREVWEGGRKEG